MKSLRNSHRFLIPGARFSRDEPEFDSEFARERGPAWTLRGGGAPNLQGAGRRRGLTGRIRTGGPGPLRAGVRPGQLPYIKVYAPACTHPTPRAPVPASKKTKIRAGWRKLRGRQCRRFGGLTLQRGCGEKGRGAARQAGQGKWSEASGAEGGGKAGGARGAARQVEQVEMRQQGTEATGHGSQADIGKFRKYPSQRQGPWAPAALAAPWPGQTAWRAPPRANPQAPVPSAPPSRAGRIGPGRRGRR